MRWLTFPRQGVSAERREVRAGAAPEAPRARLRRAVTAGIALAGVFLAALSAAPLRAAGGPSGSTASAAPCPPTTVPHRSAPPWAGLRRLVAGLTPGQPVARIGAYYFDGWANRCGFHFKGLLSPAFAGREPLSGWHDGTAAAVRAQLSWARRDGISFFIFDWYYHGRAAGADNNVNAALRAYRSLPRHDHVGFALLYVDSGPFTVPPARWRSIVNRWITHDFVRPQYARVDGKPLLVVYSVGQFVDAFGSPAGATRALGELQAAARAHGLPGVFVAGGTSLTTAYPLGVDFPRDTAAAGPWNAVTQYNYPGAGTLRVAGPHAGPNPYAQLVAAGEGQWNGFAATSPVPYIPVVMDGWDSRPWGETPYWYTRSPATFAGFVRAAIGWVRANPKMRLAPARSRPLVFVEAWNELGEGSYLVPTVGDGNRYGRALASALGIWW